MKYLLLIFSALLILISCKESKESSLSSDDPNAKLRSAYNKGYDEAKMEENKLVQKLKRENAELKEIIENERMFFYQDSVRSRLSFNEYELMRLAVEVKYNEKVISKNFESIYFLPPQSEQDKYEFLKSLMNVRYIASNKDKTIRYNFFTPIEKREVKNSIFIVSMSGYGYEAVPHIFAYFKNERDRYSFLGFFNNVYKVSYGGIEIKDLISISESEYILILKTHGGDGGDESKSLIFVEMRDGFTMNTLYEKYIHYYVDKNEKEIGYEVQKNENRVLIKVTEEVLDKKGNWKEPTVTWDTLNVKFH